MNPRKPIPSKAPIHTLIKPAKSRHARPILQLLRRNIPHLELNPLPRIPHPVIRHHPRPQHQRQHQAHTPKRGGRGERRDIFWRVFVLEDVGADDAHQVGERDAEAGQDDAFAFVGDVVVVPRVQKDGGGRGSPEKFSP